MSKVPYILVLGEKEASSYYADKEKDKASICLVSPRHYTRGEEAALSIEDFIKQVKKEITNRTNI